MSRDQGMGQQSLPVTIKKRSDIGAHFTGEPASFSEERYHMDVATAAAFSPSGSYLDELQQHYNHRADPDQRYRSQSFGTPLTVDKNGRNVDGQGSMIESAIRLMKQWSPVGSSPGLPDGRSRAASCSTVSGRYLPPTRTPTPMRSNSNESANGRDITASQERGSLLMDLLTSVPRDRLDSVSRSRSGSFPPIREPDLQEMDESMEMLTVKTLDIGARATNGTNGTMNGTTDQDARPAQQAVVNNRQEQQAQHEEQKRGFDLTSWITTRPNILFPRSTNTGHLLSGIMPHMGQPGISQATGLELLTSFLPALSVLTDRRWQDPIPVNQTQLTDPIEMQAKAHRASAAHSEPRCTWSGQLPVRTHKNPVYSTKVFLGGVPFDISDSQLVEVFSQFGNVRIQWPPNRQHVQQENRQQKCGYLYLIFEHDKNVKALLQACTHDYTRNNVLRYFFTLSSRRTKFKDVQAIPWNCADSNYVKSPAQRLDQQKTVFVGALHGMLTAEGLATVMNDLFGGVAYVGIDTDKHKYPIGSARVTFNSQRSYMKAVQAEFVEIKSHFNKKIQCDPYIESALCSTCNLQQGPIFCRDPLCFRYFCRSCWRWVHSAPELEKHKPLMRYRRE